MSAGFFGSDRPVPAIAVALGEKRGLDLSRYRSRPLTQSTVSNADLVIVMDSYQAQQLVRTFPTNRARIVIAGDLDPRFEATRSINDPWNQSSDVFEASFARLDRCAATLVGMVFKIEMRRLPGLNHGCKRVLFKACRLLKVVAVVPH
jgi:protein-tyrosine-phosphatase